MTAEYQAGFDAGERDAWKDRQNGLRRDFSGPVRGEYQRGYLDGYRPRNPGWALKQESAPWWVERETA